MNKLIVFILSFTITAVAHGEPSDPAAKGRTDADAGLRAGKLAVEMYGEPTPWRSIYARLLREQYNVELLSGAGCVITDDFDKYWTAYNGIMRTEITRRYGADVFERTDEDARREWSEQARSRTRNPTHARVPKKKDPRKTQKLSS